MVEYYLMLPCTFWTFCLFVCCCFFHHKICFFIICISFSDEVSNFRNRILTNQKQELVFQNRQWNCMLAQEMIIISYFLLKISLSDILYRHQIAIKFGIFLINIGTCQSFFVIFSLLFRKYDFVIWWIKSELLQKFLTTH